MKDLNFKVDYAFHREFKLEATKQGISMLAFFKLIYYHWRDSVSL